MNLETKIENFFNSKISLSIIFITSFLTIILSNYVYIYESELSLQDASEYIALANDPKNYFTLPHQGALRILPSLLVSCLHYFGLSIDFSFKILTYLIFIFLNYKIYYVMKKFKIKNYLILSSLAILVYSNHSIIYTVFNYYQLLDLITYIFIIYFIYLNLNNNLILLFSISLLSIFTKEYLLILVLFLHIKFFLKSRDKKILLSLITILIIFLIHFYFAGYNNESKDNMNIIALSSSYIVLFDTFFSSLINGMFINKNIFLFLPFGILFFSKNFLKFLLKNYEIIIFSLVPLGFSIFLYSHVGNNFFRVYYHGFFIIIFYGIIFLLTIIKINKNSLFLFFISPAFFLIDYFYILLNISQSGFFNFFQLERYQYISGYYLFNLIILFIILKNYKRIFYEK